MLRVLVLAAVLVQVRPAFAIELGLTDNLAEGTSDLTRELRALGRELNRWERKRVQQEPSLSIEIDRKQPFRLSLSGSDGVLDVVVGRGFVRDPALFRTLAAFLLGLSRYDRYGEEKWVARLGLADRPVWKYYFGSRHLAEVVYNADHGSALAEADVVEFWQAHVKTAVELGGAGAALQALQAAQVDRLAGLEPSLATARDRERRLQARVQRKTRALRRGGVDLGRLVRADQRDAVADALESVVPLDDLEPFERAFWHRQIALMRTPTAGGRRVTLHRALYSGKGYADGEVILAPMARDAVEGGTSATDSLATYFAIRTARGQGTASHPGVLKNFRMLDKRHTSVAINAMLANQASGSSSSPFISLADQEFARDWATRGRGARAPVRAYAIPEEQVLVASHARWNEPELMKFLFVFPSDRYRSGSQTPSDAVVAGLRTRFNRTTVGPKAPHSKGRTRKAARARR